MSRYIDRLRSVDWMLMFATFALVLFGLASIYSVALSQESSDFLNVKKQLIAVILGFTILGIMAVWNFRLLRNYSMAIYVIGILAMIAVLIFGTTVRGTTGWFDFGVFNVQPVEFMKVALAIQLATYFSQHARKDLGLKEIVQSGAMTFVPVALTILQPDFGSAMLLLAIWVVLIFFAGIRMKHVATLAVIFAITAVFGWFFILADYQQARLTTFINPSVDPLGQGYNVTQAIIAVGAGGWFGRGLGFGSQSQLKFLPESQTDFVFAVIAEELGFVGIVLTIGAFVLLFYRIYRRATLTRDDFTSFLLLGIGGVLFAQFFVNVGMNLGLLPVTGVTLPLVSYGGSSLVFTLFMLGIVQSVAVQSRASDRVAH